MICLSKCGRLPEPKPGAADEVLAAHTADVHDFGNGDPGEGLLSHETLERVTDGTLRDLG